VPVRAQADADPGVVGRRVQARPGRGNEEEAWRQEWGWRQQAAGTGAWKKQGTINAVIAIVWIEIGL